MALVSCTAQTKRGVCWLTQQTGLYSFSLLYTYVLKYFELSDGNAIL